ncbi:response regulator transcription factor [Niabella beijingensis]|uniref:response regulator transcription factor n=1 Tax=Niabella beijingensis TaxID=2872700 RepID=UPI001CBB3057|nr:response regulator transcription factor [Niabella beijingensis]MBZ4188330.1 response regulator transcription factor [Niabella beijingensis]
MDRILLVEDNAVILKTVQFILNKQGYEVVIATNGKEGLEALDREHFDLMITDLMMPFANGMELVEAIRLKAPDTRILVLSAVQNEETVTDSFDIGANDYLKKPFTPGELVSRVKRLLAVKQ